MYLKDVLPAADYKGDSHRGVDLPHRVLSGGVAPMSCPTYRPRLLRVAVPQLQRHRGYNSAPPGRGM